MASRATTHACVAARSFCITCVRARHRQLSTGLLSLERFGVWLQSIEKVSMRQLQPWQLYYQLRIGAGHRRPSTALARTAGPYAQRGGCRTLWPQAARYRPQDSGDSPSWPPAARPYAQQRRFSARRPQAARHRPPDCGHSPDRPQAAGPHAQQRRFSARWPQAAGPHAQQRRFSARRPQAAGPHAQQRRFSARRPQAAGH